MFINPFENKIKSSYDNINILIKIITISISVLNICKSLDWRKTAGFS